MVSAAFWYSLTCFLSVNLIWYSLISVSGLCLSSNRFNLAKSGNFGPFRCKTGQGIKIFPKYSPIWPISCSDERLALRANRASKTASVSHSEALKHDFSSCANFSVFWLLTSAWCQQYEGWCQHVDVSSGVLWYGCDIIMLKSSRWHGSTAGWRGRVTWTGHRQGEVTWRRPGRMRWRSYYVRGGLFSLCVGPPLAQRWFLSGAARCNGRPPPVPVYDGKTVGHRVVSYHRNRVRDLITDRRIAGRRSDGGWEREMCGV